VLVARLRAVALTSLVVLALDWGVKAAVKALSPESVVPHLTTPNPFAIPFVVLGGVVLVMLIGRPLAALALGICIGGVAGNLFERLLGGSVTDFIGLPPLLWEPGGVWNVADFAIWASVPLLALSAAQHFVALRRGGGPAVAAR
jgi:lipoprotein signal peptidase